MIKLSDRKYYANPHKKWDLDLCEWRIKNCIPALTPRSAKKFLKEINNNKSSEKEAQPPHISNAGLRLVISKKMV